MKSADRYYRCGLRATREGRMDPRPLVRQWREQLRDGLRGGRGSGSAQDLATLLIGWARLRRVRPELLAEAEAIVVLEQAERLGDAAGLEMLQRVVGQADLSGWMNVARRLSASYEEEPDTQLQERLSKQLIADLDTAELVTFAAGYFSGGRLGRASRRDLDEYVSWVHEQAADFLPAIMEVQTVGAAIRPDLPEFDPELALTAEKYIWLLDDAEDAEAEFAMEHVGALITPGALREFLKQRRTEVARRPAPSPLRASKWLPETAYTIAAAVQKAAPSYRAYRWTSPDGSLTAWLTIPPTLRGTDEERLCVEFREAGPARSAATRLAGMQALLAGVAARIDARGMAFFRLGELRAAEAAGPILHVGDPPVVWPLQPVSETAG